MARPNNEPLSAADRRRQLQRQRQPQHQAAKVRRQKRQQKEAQAREAEDYVEGKLLSGDSTPLSAEDINSFWDGQDRSRFGNLIAEHLRECKSSGTIDGVQNTINAVLKAEADCRPCPENLGLLTEDELVQRVQKLMGDTVLL